MRILNRRNYGHVSQTVEQNKASVGRILMPAQPPDNYASTGSAPASEANEANPLLQGTHQPVARRSPTHPDVI